MSNQSYSQELHEHWLERRQAMIDFHEKHGHLDIPKEYLDSTGYCLRNWARTQNERHMAGLLSDERIVLLETLSFWEWRERQHYRRPWEEHLQELIAYVNEHQKIPHFRSSLGRWHQRQKTLQRLGELDEKRAEAFKKAGFTLNLTPQHEWVELFQALKELGTIPPQNDSLGIWVYKQKNNYRSEKLSQERIDSLESLPFWDWTIKALGKDFHKRYDELELFVKKHGRHPKRREPLGHWYFKYKKACIDGRTSKEKALLLREIPGWKW